jgi:hypothetical protein
VKWLRTIIIINKGGIVSSEDWQKIHTSYVRSIQSIDFPKGSGKLLLRRKEKREDGQWNRNGVGYLRKRFLEHMVKNEEWKAEAGFTKEIRQNQVEFCLYPSLEPHQEPIKATFGDFDFLTEAPDGTRVAIEWETGNISSSHRSMNKLSIALSSGVVNAGVLIVPSRDLYEHLTDRVGNISELSSYLSLWKATGEGIERGLLAISVVEQDELTSASDHPYLHVGTDGRAKEGRVKRK